MLTLNGEAIGGGFVRVRLSSTDVWVEPRVKRGLNMVAGVLIHVGFLVHFYIGRERHCDMRDVGRLKPRRVGAWMSG
jgi:hypothetical protein